MAEQTAKTQEKSFETNAATNFVLEKLRNAGIEVVTDKAEFEKILATTERLQKMVDNKNRLEELSKSIDETKKQISEQEKISDSISQDESKIADFSFENFVKNINDYADFIPVNNAINSGMTLKDKSDRDYNQTKFENSLKIKISDLNYQRDGYRNFELYLAKRNDGHLMLGYTHTNGIIATYGDGHQEYRFKKSSYWDLYDLTTGDLTGWQTQYGYESHLELLEEVKSLCATKDFIPEISESLQIQLEAMEAKEKSMLQNYIKENLERKENIGNKAELIREQEKQEARKTVKEWATQENYDKAFLLPAETIEQMFGNETKSIGIIPDNAMTLFPNVTDHNLYAQKGYFIDHWVNHHSELNESIFDELQFVLDKYDDIFADEQNGTVVFVKQQGRLKDFLVVEEKENKLVFYDTTFLRKEIPSRFKKITPERNQGQEKITGVRHAPSTIEQGMSEAAAGISTLSEKSLEGSAPLSQNPNDKSQGNTAVAISDVNDSYNISQNSDLSNEIPETRPEAFIQNTTTYGFAWNNKIYLNPDVMNSETAVHEYTHLWDAYTKRTNPELWEKGKDILSKTHLWNEVKSDPNYADIADDDNLVLSECHARICGKIAAQVLERIASRDGEIAKDAVIDWDKEMKDYVYEEFYYELEALQYQREAFTPYGESFLLDAAEFFAQPMHDLMNGRNILREETMKMNETNILQKNQKSDIKEEKTMAEQTAKTQDPAGLNREKPYETKVSDKEFSGAWIPYHNAKLVKEAMDNGTAPFLPNEHGVIDAKPIYNANTGYVVSGKDLIPLQIAQKQSGYESDIAITKKTVEKAHTKIKANEKGFFYNFQRDDKTFGTAQFFFAEQMEQPERIAEWAQEQKTLRNNMGMKPAPQKITMTMDSAEPEAYLGKYLAACKRPNDVTLVCPKEIAEEFKKNFDAVIQNQFAKKEAYSEEIGKMNGVLFNADVRANDIIKQIDKKTGRTAQREQAKAEWQQKKQQKKEMEVSF